MLLALRRRTAGVAGTDRHRLVREGLGRCAAQLGHPPSRREYDRWRSHLPRPQDVPSATAARNAFGGSWSRVRAQLAGAVEADASSLRLTAQGASYTEQEMLAALRRAAGELGDEVSFEAYVRWARGVARAEGRGARVPRSGKPFRRQWGSWQAATSAAWPTRASRWPGARRWGVPYSRDELRAAVRTASSDLGKGAGLTYGAYDRWAQTASVLPASGARPRAATVTLAFGSWAQALSDAGLIEGAALRHRRARPGVPSSDAELVDWSRRARDELGYWPTRRQYTEWRHDKIAHACSDTETPPSEATLRLRLGGWSAARAAAACISEG